MIIKGIILVGLVVFFGIVSLASLIIYIVQRKHQRTKKVWLILFIISLTISSGTGIYTLKKVVNKTIDKSSKFKESVIESVFYGLAAAMSDDRTYLVGSSNRNPQIELLKSYESGSIPNKVPASFYSYFGFRDWYRFPLVYPYSINCIDIRNFGQIYDESNVADITKTNKGANQLQVRGITKFTFDKRYLIAKLSSKLDKERGYILFEFKTQEIEKFSSYSELLKRLNKMNYQGSTELMTIKEYDKLF